MSVHVDIVASISICDSTQPTCYLPISLLPIAGKLIEVMINRPLVIFLKLHELVSDLYSSMAASDSRTTGDLLSFETEYFSHILDKQGETLSVALDISKAFDRVLHQVLLTKLGSFDITTMCISYDFNL